MKTQIRDRQQRLLWKERVCQSRLFGEAMRGLSVVESQKSGQPQTPELLREQVRVDMPELMLRGRQRLKDERSAVDTLLSMRH